MDTCISRVVRAEPRRIFRLAAAVEDWPRLLPHYRWVRVSGGDASGTGRTVEMAARRDVVGGIGVPLRWWAVQRVHEEQMKIDFRHVRGVTRGMWVEWTFAEMRDSTRVQLRHVFNPRWPVPDVLVEAIVGEYFVNGVARRTLGVLARLAEGPS